MRAMWKTKGKIMSEINVIHPPDSNITIRVTDNFDIYAYRKKPYTWFQIKMMKVFFGWKVENKGEGNVPETKL